jgi:hypothetical protein
MSTGVRCESCGADRPDLTVKAIATDAGELCLTLCAGCANAQVDPPITIATAVRLVEEHRRHDHQEFRADVR